MSMGRRATKSWYESDVTTGWRKYLCYLQNHSGAAKVKRSIRRRERRAINHELRAAIPFHTYHPMLADGWEDSEGYHSKADIHLIVNGRDVWVCHYEFEPWGFDWDDWNNGTELPYTTETSRQ